MVSFKYVLLQLLSLLLYLHQHSSADEESLHCCLNKTHIKVEIKRYVALKY